MQFGWEGDGGIGEMLIAQTIAGTKTATCGFERVHRRGTRGGACW